MFNCTDAKDGVNFLIKITPIHKFKSYLIVKPQLFCFSP